MEMSVARRGFLRGRFGPAGNDARPPWSVGRDIFDAVCDRCSACVGACPANILRVGDGGYPEVDFTAGECSFCAECVSACRPGALRRSEDGLPWSLKFRVGESCLAERDVECRVCGETCANAAIRFRPRLGGVARPELDPDRCNGCGACFAPCPVHAIAMEMHQ